MKKNANPRDKLRSDLQKIMPGYRWTVHIGKTAATGIQTSGYNRLSTLYVELTFLSDGKSRYDVQIAGYGARAPLGNVFSAPTLAKALRMLQDSHEALEAHHAGIAAMLRIGRGGV